MTNLESLRMFVNNLTPVVKKHDEALMERVLETVGKIPGILGLSETEFEKGEISKIRTRLSEKQKDQIFDAVKDFLRLSPHIPPHNVELLYKSSFVMLISHFDFLIGDLIHYFYQRYPESLSAKELSMTLSELKLCADLTEAMDCVVKKEVDKVLYSNLEDQKRYLRDYLKIDTKENIIHWNKINEAMERRNIIVHNNSKINTRYLKSADLSVVPEKTKDLKEGRRIVINEDYFTNVFDEILIAGVILIQCCWRKWRKDDIDNADSMLIQDMYNALLGEKWPVAERLGLFSKDCGPYNEKNRLYLHINYCQALKWQNKKKELEKELKEFDVSGLSPMYVLALCALKSDRDNFYKNIEKAIAIDKGKFRKSDFMEWPLFRELRKDPDYEEKINRAYMSISSEEQKTDSKNSH